MHEDLRSTSKGPIHVRTNGTSGPAIVFVHGNSATSLAYQKQLESSLADHYRLIAIDLPGHGESPAATDHATYSLPGYAAIVREIAEQQNALDGVFVGWSLGGHVVLEAAPLLPDAAGFLIFGTPPVGKPPAMAEAFLLHPTNGILFNADLTDEQCASFATSFFREGAEIPASFIEAVRKTDAAARANFGLSVAQENYTDEVEIVKALTVPLAILHGADELLVNGAYIQNLEIPTLWRGSVQIVGDAGHAPQWENPDAFNALLDAFAKDAAK